ncbi:glycosyltransferase family 1 protein [Methanocella sp. CWC-04]|uniref:Glycosyltransferase family 1 protein n=1 Tax=Methanooceanicella nereidis TaxID=2052831 RepID=A0AAP2RCA8_9EURY|nr:glycosyltransferase family 4 protein [Methanocella sp. CWC-04]MCD1294457.1 glycosyltransferase family 1 protein [Methanocella sp. CWC-04]
METLRIAMFSWESLHAVKVGGLAPHVSELSEALASKGHEVHVFTRAGDYKPYDNVNGVRYQRVKYDQFGNIVNQMNTMCDKFVERFHSVEDMFGKFDILHGHDWHPVTALNRLKHEDGRDYILTYHSTEWGRNGNKFGSWPDAREISHREWLGGYESKKVIATSPVLKEEIQFLYSIPSEKINLIPNGIFPGKMKKDLDPGSVKERYGIHPLAPVILFVGRMRYQKGPDLLVDAVPLVLKKRGDAKFIFVGEGDMRGACERKAKKMGVSDACIFTGYLPDDHLIDIFNACDMLVVPSRNEPFGIVVLEAWDIGKPVIGTDAVQIIDNFVNGIKARMYPESIAWCITNVINKPGALKWMGGQGKKLIDAIYNWDYIADETIGLYKKIQSQ